jgi:hypothetical protein
MELPYLLREEVNKKPGKAVKPARLIMTEESDAIHAIAKGNRPARGSHTALAARI